MKNVGKAVYHGLWILIGLMAVLPLILPVDPFTQNLEKSLLAPSVEYWLGTDELGRDVLARLVYGSTISLSIAFVSVGMAFVVGGTIGLVAGYKGGALDTVLMQLMDMLLVFPGFLLALALAAVLGPGYLNLIIAVGVFSVPTFARVIRSSVISIKGRDFVEAARASGARHSRIMLAHVLPNSIGPLWVVATNRLGSAILISGGLSFLGLGVQPPSPEWGAMLAAGRQYLSLAPHLVLFPGLLISVTAYVFNLLGELGDDLME